MAKLRDLTACLAKELDLPLKSMNVLAAELRKEGLIRSAGRGLNSAKMGPSDATNLILAALSGAYATQSAEAVRALRVGKASSCSINHEPTDLPPIPVYDRLPWPHTLGEFLDGYIEDRIRYGDIPLNDFCVTNMSFSLQRNLLGWDAEIWIDDGNHAGWTISYSCNRREIIEAPQDARLDIARLLLSGRGSAMRSVTERVMDGAFFDASRCLRDEYGPEHDDIEDAGQLH